MVTCADMASTKTICTIHRRLSVHAVQAKATARVDVPETIKKCMSQVGMSGDRIGAWI